MTDHESQTTGGLHNDASHSKDVTISGVKNGKRQAKPKTRGGAYLSFENIKLSIEADSNDGDVKEEGNMSGRKYILNNVSGEAFPNQILGIIGASGGGKTTLLGLISGRLHRLQSLATKSEVCVLYLILFLILILIVLLTTTRKINQHAYFLCVPNCLTFSCQFSVTIFYTCMFNNC